MKGSMRCSIEHDYMWQEIILGRGIRGAKSQRLKICAQRNNKANVVIVERKCMEREVKEVREVNGVGMVGE